MDANDLEPEDREPKRPYQPYRFTRAPRAVRRAGVAPDNIAVMPASLLPFKKEGQSVVNGLPYGSVLLCATANRRQRKILERVSTHLKSKGHQVRTASTTCRKCRTSNGLVR